MNLFDPQKELLVRSITRGGVVDPSAWLGLADRIEEVDEPARAHGNGELLGGWPQAEILRICASVYVHLSKPLSDVDLDHACRDWLASRMGSDLPWFWEPGPRGCRRDYHGRDGKWHWVGWHSCGRNGFGRIPGILAAMRWLDVTPMKPPTYAFRGCADWLGTSLLYASGVLTARVKGYRLNEIAHKEWPNYVPGNQSLSSREMNRLGSLSQLFVAIKRLGGGPSGVCVPVMTGIEGDERTEWKHDGWPMRTGQYATRGVMLRGRHRRLVRLLHDMDFGKVAERLVRSRPAWPWQDLGSWQSYNSYVTQKRGK